MFIFVSVLSVLFDLIILPFDMLLMYCILTLTFFILLLYLFCSTLVTLLFLKCASQNGIVMCK